MKKLLTLLLCALLSLMPMALAEDSTALNNAFHDHLVRTIESYNWRTQALTVDFGGAMFSYQPGEELMELSAHLDGDEYAVQFGQEALWLKLGDEDTVLEIPYSALAVMLPAWTRTLSVEDMDVEAFSQMGMMFVTIVLTPGIQMAQDEAGFHIHYERTSAGFLEDMAAFGDAIISVDRYAEALGTLIDKSGLETGMTGREMAEAYWPDLREALTNGAEAADLSVTADIDVVTEGAVQLAFNAAIEGADGPFTIEGLLQQNEDGTAYVLTLTAAGSAQTGVRLDAALDYAGDPALSGTLTALAPEEAEIASFSASVGDSAAMGDVWTPDGWAGSFYIGADDEAARATVVTTVNEEPTFAVSLEVTGGNDEYTGFSAYLLCDGNEWGAALDATENMNAIAYWPGGNVNASLSDADGLVIAYADEVTPANDFTIVWKGENVTFSDGMRNVVFDADAQSDSLFVLSAAYSGEGIEDGEYEMFLEITDQENGWVLSLSDAQAAYAVVSCAPADVVPLSQLDPVVLTEEDMMALLRSFGGGM